MVMKTCMTFETNGDGPYIAQVTFVESPLPRPTRTAVIAAVHGVNPTSGPES